MKKLSSAVIAHLRALADTYETCCFAEDDPSCLLRCYKSDADTEAAAFVTSVLSFGRRDQFMQKVDYLFDLTRTCSSYTAHRSCPADNREYGLAGSHPAQWIRSGAWKKDFPSGSKKFYRFYSYDDMRDVFACLEKILTKEKSLGEYMRKLYESQCSTSYASSKKRSAQNSSHAQKSVSVQTHSSAQTSRAMPINTSSVSLSLLIASSFSGCRAVAHTAQSANKRMNMFLRWMVRVNSPVDLGLWSWYPASELVIPLDTHVLQVAKKMKLIPQNSTGTAKTAQLLTNVLKQVWPDDPCKGDFALFGNDAAKS
jgi:uncharacterized protein (TIGR02757 family)